MAEFQSNDRSVNSSGAHPKTVKMSTRVDLTPMVDLGFLLITFFMLTTVLAKPNVMALVMPDREGDPEPLKNSQALTFLLGPGSKIYWYEGMPDFKLDSTDYSSSGLRSVILNKRARVNEQFGETLKDDPKSPTGYKQISKLNVIIKPSRGATYKNVVDILDEMKICGISYYVLLDISKAEEAFICNPAAGFISNLKK